MAGLILQVTFIKCIHNINNIIVPPKLTIGRNIKKLKNENDETIVPFKERSEFEEALCMLWNSTLTVLMMFNISLFLPLDSLYCETQSEIVKERMRWIIR